MPSCIIEQKRKVQLKNRKERRKTLSNDEKWMKKCLVLFNLDKVTREPCHLQRTNISANQVLNNRAKPFLKESFYFHEPTTCVFTRYVIYQKNMWNICRTILWKKSYIPRNKNASPENLWLVSCLWKMKELHICCNLTWVIWYRTIYGE